MNEFRSTDATSPAVVICCKSFGDLLIAACSAERVENRSRTLSIAVASHLTELAAALDLTCPIVEINSREPGVPSMFDVRRNGIFSGLRSMASLRTAVSGLTPKLGTMIIDRAGWRERYLVAGRDWAALPERDNIYVAYRDLLGSFGYRRSSTTSTPASGAKSRRIGLFPGSRLFQKNLPITLVRSVLDECARHGVAATLYTLADERPDIEASDLPYRIIPRSFQRMVEAVSEVDLVISSDSLPGHIAERAGRPAFVFSPVPNPYWLPLSSFERDDWALFSAAASNDGRLASFLARDAQ